MEHFENNDKTSVSATFFSRFAGFPKAVRALNSMWRLLKGEPALKSMCRLSQKPPKLRKAGTLTPSPHSFQACVQISSAIEYQRHLAVSIGVLEWVIQCLRMILWEVEVTDFPPKLPTSRLFDRR